MILSGLRAGSVTAKESCGHKMRLTKRALDNGDFAAFSSIFLASSFFCAQAESMHEQGPRMQGVSPFLRVQEVIQVNYKKQLARRN
jgi:hypothetical protein